MKAGAVAAQAKQTKRAKYAHLDTNYYFVLVAVGASGVLGPSALLFLQELTNCVRVATTIRSSRYSSFSSRECLWQCSEGMLQPSLDRSMDLDLEDFRRGRGEEEGLFVPWTWGVGLHCLLIQMYNTLYYFYLL